MAHKTFWETIETTGEQLLKVVKDVIDAGNVRRVRIRQKHQVIAEFPLTVGVIGTVFAPALVAVGALAAVLTECSIDVEKDNYTAPKQEAPTPPTEDAHPQ
jgi:hypothetical protein